MNYEHIFELRLCHRRCSGLAFVALLAISLSCAPAVYAAEVLTAAAQIALMESTLTGQTKAGLPLLSRMDALETLIYGRPSSGALKDRISQLTEYLGKEDKVGSSAPLAVRKSESPQARVAKVQAVKPNSAAGSAAPIVKIQKSAQVGNSGKLLSTGPAIKLAKSPKPSPSEGSQIAEEHKPEQKQHGPEIASENGLASDDKRQAVQGEEPNIDKHRAAEGSSENEPPIKYPPELQKLMVEAIGFYRSGNADEAKKSFEHIFSIYPDCVDACFNLGSLAEKRGDTEAAIIYYSQAQRGDPSDEQVRAALFRLTGNEFASGGPQATAAGGGDLNIVPNMPSSPDNSNSMQMGQVSVGANQYAGSHLQAVQNALSTGKSILNFTLNRALSSMRYF